MVSNRDTRPCLQPLRRFALAALTGAVVVVSPQVAGASVATALELCADSDLSIPERAGAFAEAGWSESREEDAIIAALAAGIFVSNVEFDAPDSWNEEQVRSSQIATRLRERRGYDGVRFFVSPDQMDAVTLEPNGSGLATCLFTGAASDLEPVADFSDLNILVAGPRASLRGDIVKGLIVAHAFDPPEGALDMPPRYSSTFTIILDR